MIKLHSHHDIGASRDIIWGLLMDFGNIEAGFDIAKVHQQPPDNISGCAYIMVGVQFYHIAVLAIYYCYLRLLISC